MLNERSTQSRGRSRSVIEVAARAVSIAALSSSMPRPSGAAVAMIGEPWSEVEARRSSISRATISRVSSSTRSARVRATTPWSTPRRSRIARCSSDCGIQPSSAATTKRATVIASIPASMFLMKRSWPGTSTNPASIPDGSVVQANPRSMVSPRFFSSAHRSGSRPVRACTNVDFP